MKRFTRSLLSLCLALLLCAAALPGANTAKADETVENDTKTVYQLTGYRSDLYSIEINQTANVTVSLARLSGTATIERVVRGVDDFRVGGTVGEIDNTDPYNTTFTIYNLTYSGKGNTLRFTVYYTDGTTAPFDISVIECVEYTAPTPEKPETVTIPKPRAIFSSDAAMGSISAGETRAVMLYIQNAGTTVMRSPMVTVTPSDSLQLLDAQSATMLDDIRPGQSGVMMVTVKAADKITNPSQSLTVRVDFYYDNGTSVVNDSVDGSVNVPAAVSDDGKDDGTVASPTPIVILSKYSYGGSSIAAGSSANLSFTFTNTSKKIAIENVMVTVSGGTDLMLNGSTNTFYFDSVAAGGSKSVTVPVKAAQIISSSAQAVTIDVKYEYVDQKTRQSSSASLMLSVPLYQPDRFELSEPTTSYTGYVGEETSLTIDYVNKGKSAVSNVEATISGDVDTYNAYQRIGNIEGGKNGTIAFAVTPLNEGDNQVKITITYEDSNGNTKERVFEASVQAMAYEPIDPIDPDQPIDPVEPESTFPWKYVIIAAAVVLIILLIVLRARRKKAKQKAEQALWDKWDEEETAEEKKEAAEAKAEYQESAGAGAGEQKK